MAELLLTKGLAFRRCTPTAGRSGLLPRAVDDVEAYWVREGELISGVVNGLELRRRPLPRSATARAPSRSGAITKRASCGSITLESQPAHVQRQHYRIYDAATGLIEEGYVRVADMVARQPWLDAHAHDPGASDAPRRGAARGAPAHT